MAGFNRLLMMLPAAGQEQHNHKADEDRWPHVRWRPVQAVERSAFLMQSECGNYDVLWDFRTTQREVEVVCSEVAIVCSGPVRCVRRVPRGTRPAEGAAGGGAGGGGGGAAGAAGGV